MPLKIIAIGNKKINCQIARLLSGSGIDLVYRSEVAQSLELLKREKFDLALIDGYMNNVESTCFRVTWLYHTPVALIINGNQGDWDLLRNLDVDGFIPDEAGRIDIISHFTEISNHGLHKYNSIRSLIIEDDDQIREALRLSFEIYWPEAEVVFALDGREGVRLAKKGSFDIILLDLILPDISGYEVLSRVRSFSQTPIIIITANRNPEEVTQSINLGANDFIAKPFKQLELMSRIRQHINIKAATN